MDFRAMTDKGILAVLGERASRQRLNLNTTQAVLSERAGVTRIVVQHLEGGRGCTLRNMIRILRALGLLDQLDAFLPEPGLSPIQLARLKGRVRHRATGKRGKVGE